MRAPSVATPAHTLTHVAPLGRPYWSRSFSATRRTATGPSRTMPPCKRSWTPSSTASAMWTPSPPSAKRSPSSPRLRQYARARNLAPSLVTRLFPGRDAGVQNQFGPRRGAAEGGCGPARESGRGGGAAPRVGVREPLTTRCATQTQDRVTDLEAQSQRLKQELESAQERAAAKQTEQEQAQERASRVGAVRGELVRHPRPPLTPPRTIPPAGEGGGCQARGGGACAQRNGPRHRVQRRGAGPRPR